MLGPSITDWMSGVGALIAGVAAIVAAGAAIVAARYTKQAVHEAAKAAKSSADQVELQRPRPIVLMTFLYSFKPGQRNDIHQFQLENIGDSPAFDVIVSRMETPDSASQLSTGGVSHLLAGAVHSCKHRLEDDAGAVGGVLAVLSPAESFAVRLAAYFDKHSAGTLPERIDVRNEIGFTLSYRALDRRLFEQRYSFVVRFSRQQAWIEPVGSLLENSVKESPE